ncbi:MAG: HAD-IIA family hydrolase [Lentisphaeria bacterium]|nr:HAD-IIA family hydrolase [Lentisphaeria bacterium]
MTIHNNNINWKDIRLVLLDLDDTVYRSGVLFPTTMPFLNFLESQKIKYAFLSNNSSHSTEQYIARLGKTGIPATENDFYTSTHYMVDYLKKNHPDKKRLYFLGMPEVAKEVAAYGFEIVDDEPEAVIVAFDRQLVYERLCKCAYYIKQGVPAWATHPDVFCPTSEETVLVDCGAITKCIETAINMKIPVLGKPDPGMLHAAAARYGFTAEQTLMAGDRLATDVAIAKNAGATGCHISTLTEYPDTPERLRPDITCANLGELMDIWQKNI